MDFVRRLAIEARLRLMRVIRTGKADQRHPYRRAVDHPGLIGPSIENRESVRRSLQGPAVRAAAYGICSDEADAHRLARRDLLTCLHEPVADEIRLARYATIPNREHPRDVFLAQPADQQLAAEKRRIADYGIDLWPVGFAAVRHEDRVSAFDGIQGIENRVGRITKPVTPHPLNFADPYRHPGKLGGVGVYLDALHIRRADRREPAREAVRSERMR